MRIVEHARTLARHRTLVAILTARELKARYRGSLLGWLWSVVNPLLLLLVYTIVFQVVFRRSDDATRPYALFLFTGLLPWNWLAASLIESTVSLTGNGNLIRKVLFPAEVLTLTYVLGQLVHFLLSLPILALGLAAARIWLGRPIPATLVLLPLLVLLELIFIAGCSLAFAPLAVHFRDLRDLLTNVLNLGFFLTPILYVADSVPPAIRWVLVWNPVSPFVLAFQDVAFHGRFPPASRWGAMVALASGAWIVGVWTFDRLRDGLVEEV
jgi:ABC-type polysaccharide/polyol phosphate export permease